MVMWTIYAPHKSSTSPSVSIRIGGGFMKKIRRVLPLLIAAMPVAFVGIFVGVPVLIALAYSLGYTEGPNATLTLLDQHVVSAKNGITVEAYQQLFQDRAFLAVFWSTVWVTIASVVLILLVGWSLSLCIRFGRGLIVTIVSSLYLLSLVI